MVLCDFVRYSINVQRETRQKMDRIVVVVCLRAYFQLQTATTLFADLVYGGFFLSHKAEKILASNLLGLTCSIYCFDSSMANVISFPFSPDNFQNKFYGTHRSTLVYFLWPVYTAGDFA